MCKFLGLGTYKANASQAHARFHFVSCMHTMEEGSSDDHMLDLTINYVQHGCYGKELTMQKKRAVRKRAAKLIVEREVYFLKKEQKVRLICQLFCRLFFNCWPRAVKSCEDKAGTTVHSTCLSQ